MASDGRSSDRVVAIVAHAPPARAPLRVGVGDVVSVERRDSEWPAFGFVRTEAGEGWVPLRHLSAAAGTATVLTSYDTTELVVGEGEVLEVVARDDESGWLWCRDASGNEGWVPIRALRLAE